MARTRLLSTRVAFAATAAVAALVATAEPARAENLIRDPNAHTDYGWELEPHVTFTAFEGGLFGGKRGYGAQAGLGFRATAELADPAFVKTINNTVGLSFGVDITNCDWCRRDDFAMAFPVAMQWNFWFTDNWSAFGEPGLVLRTSGFFRESDLDLALAVGGRYKFNDDIGLTLRIGYPFVSFGVSFFE
jgi:hypothetical protein